MRTTVLTTSMVISPRSNEPMQATSTIATARHAPIRPTDEPRLRSSQSRVHLARSASWSPAAHVEDPNSVAFTFFEDDLLPQDDWSISEARLANIGPPPLMPREFKRYPPDVIPAVEPAQESKITISRTLLVSEQQRAQTQTIEAERTLSPPSPSLSPTKSLSAPLCTVLKSENKLRSQTLQHEQVETDYRSTANVPAKDVRPDKKDSGRSLSDTIEKEGRDGITTSVPLVEAMRADKEYLVRDVPSMAGTGTDSGRATMKPVQGPRPDKEDLVRELPLLREPSLRAHEPSTLASTLARSVSFFGRKSKDATTKDIRPSSRPMTPTKKRSSPLLKSFSSNSIPSLARSDLPLRPLSVVIPLQPGMQTSQPAVQTSSKTRDELWNAFRALDAEYNK